MCSKKHKHVSKRHAALHVSSYNLQTAQLHFKSNLSSCNNQRQDRCRCHHTLALIRFANTTHVHEHPNVGHIIHYRSPWHTAFSKGLRVGIHNSTSAPVRSSPPDLVKGVHVVHAALRLRCPGAGLKPDVTTSQHLVR